MIDIDKLLIEVRNYFVEYLPDYLTYHNWAHTLSVYRNVQHIGRKEKLSENKIYLLKIAALFHDIAYLEEKANHEEHSCVIMEKWLKKYNLPSSDLNAIKGMILATMIPQSPQNLSENVIADADLLYLGTTKYIEVSEKLYQEFYHYNSDWNAKKWKEIQINFISSHHYHTAFCKRYYEWKKQHNLKKVINGI